VVPDKVLEEVKNHFEKANTRMEKITYKACKDFLKLRGYSMYYKNINQIVSRVRGAPTVVLE
jgi:Poxvirus Late Transcription Factor VLTF3 like.